MWKPLIRSSIIGGLIVFLWIMTSWMILPMHKSMMNKFQDEETVTSCVMEQAPKSGIYVIPHSDFSPEDREEAMKSSQGPFIFMSIKREGINLNNMVRPMVIALITQILAAFLITYLLLKTKKMKYWNQVLFVTIVGGIVALVGLVPPWNWWGFPATWIICEMFDVIVGWFLGGLVIARLAKK